CLVGTPVSRNERHGFRKLRGNRLQVLHATESKVRRPIEWPPRILIFEEVALLIPGAAKDIKPIANRARCPFLNVAGHIVRSERAQSAMGSNPCGTLSAEIAEAHDFRIRADPGGSIPVIGRR